MASWRDWIRTLAHGSRQNSKENSTQPSTEEYISAIATETNGARPDHRNPNFNPNKQMLEWSSPFFDFSGGDQFELYVQKPSEDRIHVAAYLYEREPQNGKEGQWMAGFRQEFSGSNPPGMVYSVNIYDLEMPMDPSLVKKIRFYVWCTSHTRQDLSIKGFKRGSSRNHLFHMSTTDQFTTSRDGMPHAFPYQLQRPILVKDSRFTSSSS